MDRIFNAKQGQVIADALENRDWSDIDIAMRRFGFQTESNWSGDKKTYILRMLPTGNADDISDLASFLNCALNASNETVPNSVIWGASNLRVFISHLSEEKEFATEIQDNLKRFRVSSFVAHEDISPDEEWVEKIESALFSCDFLVALMHEDFHKSHWTDQEIGYAIGGGKPVFSVRLGLDPYGFIGRFQSIPAQNANTRAIATKIFKTAIKNEKTTEKAGECLIDALENSSSFLTSTELAGYLSELSVVKSVWAETLAAAFDTNSQLSGAWEVPEAFNAFFEKAGRRDLCISPN